MCLNYWQNAESIVACRQSSLIYSFDERVRVAVKTVVTKGDLTELSKFCSRLLMSIGEGFKKK